ncbi:hypothetical protein [Paraburkholderia sp. J63]|uniref:hypothetical protein n=1 Tax=Paraburkholderia sp. J63 TaxID=2805434 RepID=UPI002ABD9437|nr:hypothetical protein [Paraburkholderia sp. J63]
MFGTLTHWVDWAHFQIRGLGGRVAAEMDLQVLVYKIERVVGILGFADATRAKKLAGAGAA